MNSALYQRAKALFLEVCDIPAAHRAAALAERSRGDDPLRAAVEAMLAAEADPVALDVASMRAGLESVVDGISCEPTQIGRYRVIRRVGEGGFGTVYEAEQVEPMTRRVALKVIKLGMDTRSVIARFEAERQTLALMDHPNIARVFDAGVTDAGRPFFVMEWVDGAAVTTYCDQQRLAPRERLALFIEICDAAQHAHQRGVIHRDIKPSNVLVRDAAGGSRAAGSTPKLIDFGIARAIDADGSSRRTTYTEQGQLVGTPEYMSPEQASGGPIDTRTDIYSLGVLLYEMLTGTVPLDVSSTGASSHRAALAQMQRVVCDAEPPKPSARITSLGQRAADVARKRRTDGAGLRRMLRGDLDWIVMRCIEKDPARRYPSAAALADDVRHHLAGEPVTAAPPSTAYVLSKFARRNRAALATSIGMFVLLIIGVIGTSLGMRNALIARDVADAQRERADREAAIARAVNDFLNNDLLAAVRPEAAGRDVSMRVVLDAAAKKVNDRFVGQPAVEAALRLTLASTYFSLGVLHEAEQHALRARELAVREFGAGAPQSRAALRQLGDIYSSQARYADAQRAFGELVDFEREHRGPDDPETQKDLDGLALAYSRDGNLRRAAEIFEQLYESRLRALGAENDATLDTLGNLASMYLRSGDNARARPLLERALAARRRRAGDDHPDTLFVRSKLAVLCVNTGEYSKAGELYDGLIGRLLRVFGPEHPNTYFIMCDLASFYLATKQVERAETTYLDAIEGLRHAVGGEHADTVLSMQSLADVYMLQARYADAECWYRLALEGSRRSLGNVHPYTLTAQVHLASCLATRARIPEAAFLIGQVIERARVARVPVLPDDLIVLGRCMIGLDRLELAEAALLEAERVASGQAAFRDDYLNAIERLIELYQRWDRSDEAEAWRGVARAATEREVP